MFWVYVAGGGGGVSEAPPTQKVGRLKHNRVQRFVSLFQERIVIRAMIAMKNCVVMLSCSEAVGKPKYAERRNLTACAIKIVYGILKP